MPTYSLGEPAVAAFILLPLLLTALLLWGTGSAYESGTRTGPLLAVGVGALLWLGATWAAAGSGILRLWDATPPPFAFLVAGILVIAVLLVFSPLGLRLISTVPLWVLVLVQAFRLPLELAMHAMYEQGIMPVQMSYSGRNFDIVTGATAIVVALILRQHTNRTLALVWNVMGLALLVNVVVVSIASTPRFAMFGSEQLNVWVTYPPFVWLPAALVLAALAGHLLVFRAISRMSEQPGAAGRKR